MHHLSLLKIYNFVFFPNGNRKIQIKPKVLWLFGDIISPVLSYQNHSFSFSNRQREDKDNCMKAINEIIE